MSHLPKILIVDAKPALAEFYQDFLKLKEFQTNVTEDADSALTMIGQDVPDLIVADIPNLPNGDKITAVAKNMNIGLIFASTFKDFEYESLPSFVRVINKPFRGNDLKYSVRAELAKRSRPDEDRPQTFKSL